MVNHKKDLKKVIKLWPEVSKLLSTIQSESQYETIVGILDDLIDEVSRKSDPVVESLIDTLGTIIKDYEDRNIKEPGAADAAGVLKYLMEEHNLKQSDLKEIGSQGVVSEILSGKRRLNLRQIAALSKRFSVPQSVFLEEPD